MHDSESGLTFHSGPRRLGLTVATVPVGTAPAPTCPHLPQPAGYGLETRWQWSRDHANGRLYGSGAVLLRMGDSVDSGEAVLLLMGDSRAEWPRSHWQ